MTAQELQIEKAALEQRLDIMESEYDLMPWDERKAIKSRLNTVSTLLKRIETEADKRAWEISQAREEVTVCREVVRLRITAARKGGRYEDYYRQALSRSLTKYRQAQATLKGLTS